MKGWRDNVVSFEMWSGLSVTFFREVFSKVSLEFPIFEVEGVVTLLLDVMRMPFVLGPFSRKGTPLRDEDSETFVMNIVKGVKDTGPALRLGYVTHIENTVSL